MNRKYIVVLSLILSLGIAGALAVPVIQVTVQDLGAGYSDVLSPVDHAWVNHVFKIEQHKIYLDAVRIKFDGDLPQGAYIRIELRDCNDNVLASGETILSQDLQAGTSIEIDVSPDLDLYSMIQYDKIVVVVAGNEVGT